MAKQLALAALILFPSTFSLAQTDLAKRDSMIAEMLSLSGVRRQTEQLPMSVRDIFAEMKLDIDKQTSDRINTLIDKAFLPDSLGAYVVRHMKKNFDTVRGAGVIEWLHTPLAQKIVQLEIRAGLPEARYEITRLAKQLNNNPPSESRMQLIHKLDDATSTSAFSVDLATSTFRSLVETVNRSRPDDEQIPEVQVAKAIVKMQKELPSISRTSTAVMFLYTYRSLYDAELAQYIDFYSSENGRWYWRTLSAGLSDAVKSAAARMEQLASEKK